MKGGPGVVLPDSYILYDRESSYRRLLAAPLDLAPAVAVSPGLTTVASAAAPHRDIFLRYLVEIESALAEAEPWWQGIVDKAVEREESAEDGLLAAYSQRPAGPAAHGDIVGAVRRAWLEADAVNRTLPEPQRIPPQDLVLRWPAELARGEIVAVLTCMPYWPIGLDADGNWC